MIKCVIHNCRLLFACSNRHSGKNMLLENLLSFAVSYLSISFIQVAFTSDSISKGQSVVNTLLKPL